MKKSRKIALAVIGALIVLGGGVAVWQWNNFNALRYSVTLDSDTLNQQMEENKAVFEQALKDFEVESHEFSEDEMEQLSSGSMTSQQAAQQMVQPKDETPAAPETPAEPEPVPVPGADEEIKALIAEMYALRATYLGKLDAVVMSAIDEYMAGEQTSENRTAIVYGKMDELVEMEKDCDRQVSVVVTRLRELLQETGRDDSLAKEIEAAYREEKSLQKAYYLKVFRKE